MTDPQRTDWRDQAACRGKPTEWFFASHGGGSAYDAARLICRACPVAADCLAACLAQTYTEGRQGFWAGLTPEQREPMLQRPTTKTCEQCGDEFERAPQSRKRFCEPCVYKRRQQYNRHTRATTRAGREAKSVTLHAGMNIRSTVEFGQQNSGPGAALTARDPADTTGGCRHAD